MSILKRNNVTIHKGGEQVLLLAHGFGCDQQMWRFIIPAFKSKYTLVLFDYVGCGKSDINAYDENRYDTLEGYALDIIEICEALNLRDVHLIAHSVSCMIGVLADTLRPELFKTLIMVGPSSCYLNKGNYLGGFSDTDIQELLAVMDNNYLEWANYLAPIVMKNDNQPELTKELQESFCSMDKQLTKNFARVTFFSDNREDLPKVATPSLIMQCSDDDIAPITAGEYVHNHLPESRIVYLQATGHCPHMSHPEETIDIISKFLSKSQ